MSDTKVNDKTTYIKKLGIIPQFPNSDLRNRVNDLKAGNDESKSFGQQQQWMKLDGHNIFVNAFKYTGSGSTKYVATEIVNGDDVILEQLKKAGVKKVSNKISGEIDFDGSEEIEDYGGKKRRAKAKPKTAAKKSAEKKKKKTTKKKSK